MAYTTINKPSDYFNTKLYTGTGSSQSITGVNFQPDWVWIKRRGASSDHLLYDAIRGVQKTIKTNSNVAEDTFTQTLLGFASDGFSIGTDGDINNNTSTYSSWNWKANGAGSANTDGSINSTVSANTTSGFSIVSYTGNGTGNSTIGHGLGATPKFIIVKNLTTAQSWGTKSDSFVSASDPRVLYLNASSSYANDTNVWGTSAVFNNTTFTVGDWNGSNQSGSSFIAYCFAEKTGYSKFGSYIGNNPAGSSNRQFIYTGMKPAFVMIKESSGAGHWVMYDNKRANTFNPATGILVADDNGSENSNSDSINFLSNGFYITDTSNNLRTINANNESYTYMCFAEAPLVGTNNIPANAR